jgi:23S rRNA (uracil1939-C5)-methyltransferase
VERTTGKIQLTLVWNASPYTDSDTDAAGKDLLDGFTKHLVGKSSQLQLHSLWVHFNSQWKHADNVFDYGSSSDNSSLWKHVHGPKHIIETLDLSQCPTPSEVKLHFPPNVFRQANLDAFTKIVISIRKYVMAFNEEKSGADASLPSCVELYGGVGTIGLNICDLLSSFVSSDENPYNKACFENAVKSLSSKNRKKCQYIPKNATDVIKEGNVLSKDCEIILVDPPRKGLDEYVTQSFVDAEGAKLLIYVSCGFDAFTKDCDLLLQSGKWKLDQAEGHLLFPGSDAIETLAFFRRT